MYAVYRQLHPPTGMEHCLYAHFFSSTEKNLIVAGVNQLFVYRLNTDAESKSQEKNTDVRSRKEKLECLAQFSLFGNILSMETVRLAGNTRDSLLISFKDAKLSVVDYDPGTHDLKTSSLHYFEEEDLKNGCTQQTGNLPLVRVDPEGRCAAMLIYGTRLVIIPFRRETSADDHDPFLTSSKSQIMSSYIINLHEMDEKITNVVDFQFLHGYYEPTIFILYEPLPTWSGRVAVRRDTCTIVAISLNLQQKVHPVIWSLSGLPFDCFKALPVQRPIGGVLVFAINSLIYLNQSVPPYGVSLNSLTDFSTEFLLTPQEGVKISLDCCQACFIGEDRLVMSLKGGELYVITLVVDGMRSVRAINFDKAAASVLTTCMCHCEEGYLFLGSRLGNSLLLKYTEKASEGAASMDLLPSTSTSKKTEEPPSKKKKTDYMGDWMASDVSKLDDLDELEVYGSEAQSGTTITSYTFEVCDSILNIGPCSQTVMGEPAFLSEEFSNLVDPDVELVSTSGYGKNGALSVLQRSIRPQVVTTFELPGCQDMWTVIGPERKKEKLSEDEEEEEEEEETKQEKKAGEEEAEEVEGGHALLLLSREDSSMVLETGQEINELDHSGFSTQGPTVYAGNIGDNRFIIQVSPMGIRLLDGVNQIQHIPLDVGSPIVTCSVADPYMFIMSEEGVVMLLTLREDFDHGPRLSVSRPPVPQTSRILTLAAYCDVSGLFTTTSEEAEPEAPLPTPEIKMPNIDDLAQSKTTVDDEDELLYGSSENKGLFDEPKEKEPEQLPKETPTLKKEIKPTYWFLVSRENGVFEVYSLPDFKLVFLVKNFPVGHRVLVDSGQANIPDSQCKVGSDKPIAELLPVQELLIVGLGNKRSRPHLFARVEEEMLLYEAFPYHVPSATDNHLKLRFRKVPHGLILREKKTKKTKEDTAKPIQSMRWFRPFDNISGYSGVFVCGPYPHWLFMSQRGALRFHPMGIDGTVTCFAPFHNVNCPRGFLYFNRQGELRISVLPTHLSYDAPWPIRKVPLRCTPHFVQYHMESKTYSVVTSVGELCNRMVRLQGEGEKEFDVHEQDDRFIYPMVEKFSAQLFSPLSWEAIPNTKFDLEDFEHVTCMKNVYLKSEGTVSGLKGYIALSTNYTYTEDVTSRGRILIYDVIEVVPEPGQPLTKNKIKLEYDKEQKGPVTALDHVQGFLITAIGQKIYIWQLKDGDLSGVAFIDTQVYIHTISTIKNLIVIADVLHSVSLLRYQVDMKVLSLVSRDVKPLEVYAAGFLVDNTTLTFLVSDREKNLILFAYQPEVRDSQGGMRLMRRADINVGSKVNTFFRMRCKLTDPSTEKKASAMIEKRHITYFTTLDGSLSYLLPITEKTYRRLSMLQSFLYTNIAHHAGLNPKAYRLLQSEMKLLTNSMKNIIDGDICWKYLHLSQNERTEIVHRIGTTDEQILEDLMDIDRYSAHF